MRRNEFSQHDRPFTALLDRWSLEAVASAFAEEAALVLADLELWGFACLELAPREVEAT